MLSGKEGCYQHSSNLMVLQGSAAIHIHIAAVNEDLQQGLAGSLLSLCLSDCVFYSKVSIASVDR